MKTSYRKRHSLWIDLLLVTTIFLLGFVIVYLTVLNDQPLSSNEIEIRAEEEINIEETPHVESTPSAVSEEDSVFPGVRIVTDISNDETMPFAIQYPLTEYETFNETILTYIHEAKEDYLTNMQKQKSTTDLAGELNISLQTYAHEHYYSFVLTNKTILNQTEKQAVVTTFLIDNDTGELFNLSALLNADIQSLETFAEHVRADISKNTTYKDSLLADALTQATQPQWQHFERFALKEDSLIVYFDEGEIMQAEAGLPTVELSLSLLNPLLAAPFQLAMAEEETITESSDDPSQKRIALTFDDGPHPEVTKQILELLAKYDAKATFFMLGSRVQYYPNIVVEVRDAGHEIGNHTWTHPVLTKMKAASIQKEFETTEQAIVNAIGQNSTVFRPPYGAINDAVRALIPRTSVNWTIDTLDWKHRDAKQLLPMVKEALHNNAIVLMHDIHQSTADGLEPVLQYLQSEGYQFVTVSEILEYQ